VVQPTSQYILASIIIMDNYLIGRNKDTNTFDMNLIDKGSFRIVNGKQRVFEIDYLGNTVFTNDLIGNQGSCLKFGSSNKICNDENMNFTSPNGIRFNDDILIRKSAVFGTNTGMTFSNNDLSIFTEGQNNIKFQVGGANRMVVSSNATNFDGDIYASNGRFKNVISDVLTLNGVQITAPNGQLAFDQKIDAKEINVETMRAKQGVSVRPDWYGPLVEANLNNDANRFGIGHYDSGTTRVYAGGINQLSSVRLGFAQGSGTWDDKIVMKNDGSGIVLNGDVTINGKVRLGQYTFEADQTDPNKLLVSLNGRPLNVTLKP